MTTLEIVVLVAGIVFILLSFLLFKESTQEESGIYTSGDILIQGELNEIRENFIKELEQNSTDITSETESKLSKISNETIISVNDFADQLMAKLNNNHDEVVFLYNMLQDKEEQMKSTLERMEVIRKESLKDADKLKDTENKTVSGMSLLDEGEVNALLSTNIESGDIQDSSKKQQNKNKNSNRNKQNNKKNTKKNVPDAVKTEAEKKTVPEDEQTIKRNKILDMYKNNMSIVDISKSLGLGQGEVKLIIDLYGR